MNRFMAVSITCIAIGVSAIWASSFHGAAHANSGSTSVSMPPPGTSASVAASGAQSATQTAELPTSIRAVYKVYRNGLLIGNVEERFERSGDRYKITSDTKAEGALAVLVREELSARSEGRISSTGLVPSVFASSRKSDTSRNFTSRFDWAKGELVREFTNEGKADTESFDLPKGAQDRLSAMYQFMVAPKSSTVNTLMTQGKDTERYRYLKEGEPALATRAGQFATVHYRRDANEGESKAELWLAKDKFFVPVRAIFTDKKGVAVEQSLVELSIS
jgi:hypothetical protein